jgi:penicillin-binding protein 1A
MGKLLFIALRRQHLLLFLLVHAVTLSEPAFPAQADPDTDLPRLHELEIFKPGEPAILYSGDGQPFASLATEFRIFVPIQSIPKHVQLAVLDTEDARFYEHGPISIKGMARAALRNLTSAKVKEGGSTITQQLVKVLFLSPERTMARKLREIQLASEIEWRYPKEKILEMYLNAVYFGEGAYGIEAAARTYFGKSVQSLTLPEAALLAGIIKAPALYSPRNHVQRARERRNYVLTRMQKEGHISSAQVKVAARLLIRLNPFFKDRGVAPFFVDFVRKEIEQRYGKAGATKGGLRVYTTLDSSMQRLANEIFHKEIQPIEKSLLAKSGSSQPGQETLQAALVALDPATGEVQAMVGGIDYGRTQFNRAAQAKRQPGSTFKPFVYAAALDSGFSPTAILSDEPVGYPILKAGRVVEWSPSNYDGQFRGPVTLRRALEESLNVPTVRLAEMVGVDPIVALARRLGISSELRKELALALGVSEVNLLELVSAYGVFANRGIRVPPTAIRWVESQGGEMVDFAPAIPEQAIREEIAFLMTNLLQGVVERGTGRRARIPTIPVAGKTGTSQDANDLWFVGYTPRLAAGIWIGFDQPRSLGSHESAGKLVAPIWASFMRRAHRGLPIEEPYVPPGLFSAQVNRRTGRPSVTGDPDGITEFFYRDGVPPHPSSEPGALKGY